jgi:anti-anti-sigma regulatory factor
MEVANGTAKIYMSGVLSAQNLPYLQEVINDAKSQNAQRLVMLTSDLKEISNEAIRYLIMQKQKLGSNEDFVVVGSQGAVKQALIDSEFSQEISLQDQLAAKA